LEPDEITGVAAGLLFNHGDSVVLFPVIFPDLHDGRSSFKSHIMQRLREILSGAVLEHLYGYIRYVTFDGRFVDFPVDGAFAAVSVDREQVSQIADFVRDMLHLPPKLLCLAFEDQQLHVEHVGSDEAFTVGVASPSDAASVIVPELKKWRQRVVRVAAEGREPRPAYYDLTNDMPNWYLEMIPANIGHKMAIAWRYSDLLDTRLDTRQKQLIAEQRRWQ